MADYNSKHEGAVIDNEIDRVLDRETVIDETSTDNDIPTSKSVVDYVEGRTINPVKTPSIQLKAISKVTQAITSDVDGTIPNAEIVQESNKITVVNGEVEYAQDGFYRVQLQLNLTNANNTQLDTWAEYYNGSVWVSLADSGNIIDTVNGDAGNKFIETTFGVSAGFKVRLKVRVASGSASLTTETLPNGVVVPSLTMISYELDKDVFSLDLDTENLTQPLLIGSGNNFTKFEEDGTMVAEGDATCWDDLANSLVGKRLASNQGTVDYNWSENSISFSANGDITDDNDKVILNLQKPHGAKTDSITNFHIHWEQEDSTDREFTVRYRIQENGQLKETAWTTVSVLTNANNAFAYTSGILNQITSLVAIDWSTAPLSSTVQIQFTRTDSVAGVVNVVFADSHVEYNMIGSRQEFVK